MDCRCANTRSSIIDTHVLVEARSGSLISTKKAFLSIFHSHREGELGNEASIYHDTKQNLLSHC